MVKILSGAIINYIIGRSVQIHKPYSSLLQNFLVMTLLLYQYKIITNLDFQLTIHTFMWGGGVFKSEMNKKHFQPSNSYLIFFKVC